MQRQPIGAQHLLPRHSILAITINSLRRHMLDAQSPEVDFFLMTVFAFQRFKQKTALISLPLVDRKLNQMRNERRIVWPAFDEQELAQIFTSVQSNRLDV